MQVARLLEMIYLLLEKKKITAKELADYFEVSQRTIYRDMDVLSGSGIPIYATKGRNGGIQLMDSYVLNKSLLSETERVELLSSLKGFQALQVEEVEPVIRKLSALFANQEEDVLTNWIDVDFSNWGSSQNEKERFYQIKGAILNKNLLMFQYFGAKGSSEMRKVEPYRLLFKGQSWYLKGFCLKRNDFRMFKLGRIQSLQVTEHSFARREEPLEKREYDKMPVEMVELLLKIEKSLGFRVYDEFYNEHIEETKEGFLVRGNFSKGSWLIGYLLSFGTAIEVLEPKEIREELKNLHEECLKKYLS